jgi:hypothetical protein
LLPSEGTKIYAALIIPFPFTTGNEFFVTGERLFALIQHYAIPGRQMTRARRMGRALSSMIFGDAIDFKISFESLHSSRCGSGGLDAAGRDRPWSGGRCSSGGSRLGRGVLVSTTGDEDDKGDGECQETSEHCESLRKF